MNERNLKSFEILLHFIYTYSNTFNRIYEIANLNWGQETTLLNNSK